MRDKKAVSAVVATVLIILITVAAVTIIWQGVNLLIGDKIDTQASCTKATADFSVITSQGYTCYNSSAPGSARIQVHRGSGEGYELKNITVTAIGGGTTQGSQQVADLLPNTDRILVIASANVVDGARIAPTIKVGNIEETCPATDPFPVPLCE